MVRVRRKEGSGQGGGTGAGAGASASAGAPRRGCWRESHGQNDGDQIARRGRAGKAGERRKVDKLAAGRVVANRAPCSPAVPCGGVEVRSSSNGRLDRGHAQERGEFRSTGFLSFR
ncbi:hypothetical protein BS50DRAFT_338598 [Corynespora cassiicola Philippines]|uniref:Uncharacterized protein n=1 Tax=Corynespora cassiicola Philippines TaxID=1448308 RepID=A0A2T2NV18_CORCC|nr:hypothetical protein BS50DRAFT_338598 [Corynespora cassiicola Philippines]